MHFATADLYDKYTDDVQVAQPMFNDYGGNKRFCGAISTLRSPRGCPHRLLTLRWNHAKAGLASQNIDCRAWVPTML